jgi:hypothetical protein
MFPHHYATEQAVYVSKDSFLKNFPYSPVTTIRMAYSFNSAGSRTMELVMVLFFLVVGEGAVLGFELRASHLLGRCSTIQSFHQPCFMLNFSR